MQVIQTVLPVLVIISTVIISWIVYRVKLMLSRNPQYNLALFMSIVICFSLMVLPSGSEWRILLRSTEQGNVSIHETFKENYQSTIMVTAQNKDGITIDAVEVPISQFIGGGIDRVTLLDGQNYSYSVIYVNSNTVRIEKEDEVKQIRIWAK